MLERVASKNCGEAALNVNVVGGIGVDCKNMFVRTFKEVGGNGGLLFGIVLEVEVDLFLHVMTRDVLARIVPITENTLAEIILENLISLKVQLNLRTV